MSNATVFDFILSVMIGAIAARALTGGAPYFPSMAAIGLKVVIHWALSWASRWNQWLGNLIKGYSSILIRDGQVFEKALAREHMSDADLHEDLRSKGVASSGEVKEARLERSGKLSVIKIN